MPGSRRDFIKYVVAGSVASGCPVDVALIPDPGLRVANFQHRTARPSSMANTSKSATKSATATTSNFPPPLQKQTS